MAGGRWSSDREIGRTTRLWVMASAFLLAERPTNRSEKGVTAIEYGLIASLIAVAIITALLAVSGKVTTMFNTIANSLV